jgi:hypothetical protein
VDGDTDEPQWLSDDDDRVPSPGGWIAPAGSRPGWSWAPDGLGLRLERMPWWVRVWMRIPVADRRAHVYRWHHGGFDVTPPP